MLVRRRDASAYVTLYMVEDPWTWEHLKNLEHAASSQARQEQQQMNAVACNRPTGTCGVASSGGRRHAAWTHSATCRSSDLKHVSAPPRCLSCRPSCRNTRRDCVPPRDLARACFRFRARANGDAQLRAGPAAVSARPLELYSRLV